MTITDQQIHTTVKALRLIFWGGLICIFDFTITSTVNGEGWKLDIINDLVGMIMITWGVRQLCGMSVQPSYQTAIYLVLAVSVLSCLEALHAHWIYDVPPLISFLLSVHGVLSMAAIVVFCVAMRWLCREFGLARAEESWKITTWLFVGIYLIPLGFFHGSAAITIATERSFNINLGPVGLLLIPVFCIPLVHLFVSTSRMKNDAESLAHRN